MKKADPTKSSNSGAFEVRQTFVPMATQNDILGFDIILLLYKECEKLIHLKSAP